MKSNPRDQISDTGPRGNEARNTGLSMALFLLLLSWLAANAVLVTLAVLFLFLALLAPKVFRPLVAPWQAVFSWLGARMSCLVLTGLFFLLVTPVGLLRRLFGADPLRLRQWRRGRGSVFNCRDHLYVSGDLDHPY